jgi:hypothetical protein
VSQTSVAPPDVDVAALFLGASAALLPTFDVTAVRDELRETFPAQRVPVYRGDGIREGRAFRLEVGLGTVALRSFDPARAESAGNPDDPSLRGPAGSLAARFDAYTMGQDHRWIGDVASGYAKWLGHEDPGSILLRGGVSPRARITEWSRKSRARMLRAYAELDYSVMNRQPGIPGMVTLTYPGEWLSVCPAFKVVKRHLRLFRKRFGREFGYVPAGLWKMEFQGRGAPHYHLFLAVPVRARDGRPFERWLGDTWANIVDHQDPVQRSRHRLFGTHVDFGSASNCIDARRIAVYFLKHGTKTRDGKEYQNQPPAEWGITADELTGEVIDDGGTGRFWGYWGLQRHRAAVDVTLRDFYRLRRLVRSWRRSQGQTVKGMGLGGGNSGGWVLVNDGPSFAALLSRALAAAG